MKIVFMGSPEISVPTLRALADNYQVVGVVTQPDRQAGRGKKLSAPAVKTAALELGIPVIQPEKLKNPEVFEQLQAWAPDMIVVMAFGRILRSNILELPEYGCINVHASLLPRWRGASPIQAAILHGDAETGITIMKMDPGMDTGPWLSMRSIPIDDLDTGASLSDKLAKLGAELLIETLPGYLEGSIRPQAQSESAVTFSSLINKQDGLLDFSEPADVLDRKVRAYYPWPSAFFQDGEGVIKVHRAHPDPVTIQGTPGTRLVRDHRPAIICGEGILVLDELQTAGKKAMQGDQFLMGYRNWGSR